MAQNWLSQNGYTGFSADRVLNEVNNLQVIPSVGILPNYTILPPSNLKIYNNSTTVPNSVPLSEILKPDAGCVALATCTKVK